MLAPTRLTQTELNVSRKRMNRKNQSAEDNRVLAVLGHHLYAIDAGMGELIRSFGRQGAVDVKAAYDRDVAQLSIHSSSPGVIYKNTLVVSVRVSEARPAAPGDTLAFNVITGRREWIFHTIPRPGEFGYGYGVGDFADIQKDRGF